jgi:hypothetical protein
MSETVYIETSILGYLTARPSRNVVLVANAQIQGKLAEISLDFGYELPVLCTPYELLGG